MAIYVRRSNEKQGSFHEVIEPQVQGEDLYFSWITGGLQRAPFWSMRIEPSSFESVIATMLDADYETSVMAFADALTKRKPRIP